MRLLTKYHSALYPGERNTICFTLFLKMNRLVAFLGVLAGVISLGGYSEGHVGGQAYGMAEEVGGMLNQVLASIGTCHLILFTPKGTSVLLSATK